MVLNPLLLSHLGFGGIVVGLAICMSELVRHAPREFRPTRAYLLGIVCGFVGWALYSTFSSYQAVPSGSRVFSEAPSLATKPIVLPASEFLAKGQEYPVKVVITLRVADPEALLKGQKPGELKDGLQSFLESRIEEQLNLAGEGLQVVKAIR